MKSVTKFLRQFDIEEKAAESFENKFKNLKILLKSASNLDSEKKVTFRFDFDLFY